MSPDSLFKLIQRAQYKTSGLGVDWCTIYVYDEEAIYVLFQGSTTAGDWIRDFEFWPAPVKPYKDMKQPWYCHAGIAKMYKSVRDEIRDCVELLQEDKPTWKLVIAGHSQGGGIAQLCAEDLAYIGNSVDCVTFGSPKVFYGNQAKQHLHDLKVTATCYENGSDIVPTVPPGAFSLEPVHVGEPFRLRNVFRTAEYHMGYGDPAIYQK